MGQTLEGADAVHRVVKRGRPAKALFAAGEAGVIIEAPVIDENGRRLYKFAGAEAARLRLFPEQSEAQAYAMRVWSGQSVDLPPAERKERVFNALRGQNLSTDGIIFP